MPAVITHTLGRPPKSMGYDRFNCIITAEDLKVNVIFIVVPFWCLVCGVDKAHTHTVIQIKCNPNAARSLSGSNNQKVGKRTTYKPESSIPSDDLGSREASAQEQATPVFTCAGSRAQQWDQYLCAHASPGTFAPLVDSGRGKVT